MDKQQYKVNLHILENCNFNCKYCFSQFYSKKILKLEDWIQVIDNCTKDNLVSEFNIAGGEPLLHKDLHEIIKYIKVNKGLKVSIITNGFYIDEDWIKNNIQYIETIGFSLDSLDNETLHKIGRHNKNNELFNKDRFLEVYHLIKKYNENCKIKLNTVINKYNYQEEMYKELSLLKIDRWKILKIKKLNTEKFNNLELCITDEEYDTFIKNNVNEGNKNFVVVETDMRNGYFIIDSNGCLLDNSNDFYIVVGNLLEEDFNKVFNAFNFNNDLYNSRYQH